MIFNWPRNKNSANKQRQPWRKIIVLAFIRLVEWYYQPVSRCKGSTLNTLIVRAHVCIWNEPIGADLRARDTEHSLCLPGRRRSYPLRLHHQGPCQSYAFLSRVLRANNGKSSSYSFHIFFQLFHSNLYKSPLQAKRQISQCHSIIFFKLKKILNSLDSMRWYTLIKCHQNNWPTYHINKSY